jgi:hypothetical protein
MLKVRSTSSVEFAEEIIFVVMIDEEFVFP